MEDITLMPFQLQAITAIQKALTVNDKYIVVDIPIGYGKSIVLAKTVEEICKLNKAKILVVTNAVVLKEKLIDTIFKKYSIKHRKIIFWRYI